MDNFSKNNSTKSDRTINNDSHSGGDSNHCKTIDSSELIEISSNDSANEDEEQERVNWSKLPSPVLGNVFTFLSRNDQCRMSLTCSRWAKEYSSPCIWKKIKFFLPEHEINSEVYPEVKFARKHGVMFRHVEIICKKVRFHMLYVISQQLAMFLDSLTSTAQLHSIKIINLQNYLRHLEETQREETVSGIERFFRSQNHLRSVEIYDSHFRKYECVQLLRALFLREVSSVKNLSLRAFCRERPGDEDGGPSEQSLLSPEVCANILGVRNLYTEYSSLFVEMVNSEGRRGSLSNLHLVWEGRKRPQVRPLSSADWRRITASCPGIKLDLSLMASPQPRPDIEALLVRDIPLHTLTFHCGSMVPTSGMSMSVLLEHLLACRAGEVVETLVIIWGHRAPDLFSALHSFLGSSRKLKFFHIVAQFPLEGVEDALKSLIDRRPPALSSFCLTHSHVRSEEDYERLLAVAEEYYPLLKAVDVEMILLGEPGWRTRRHRQN